MVIHICANCCATVVDACDNVIIARPLCCSMHACRAPHLSGFHRRLSGRIVVFILVFLPAVTAAVAIAARNRAGAGTSGGGGGGGKQHEEFYSSDEESRDGDLSSGSASEDEGSDGYQRGAHPPASASNAPCQLSLLPCGRAATSPSPRLARAGRHA